MFSCADEINQSYMDNSTRHFALPNVQDVHYLSNKPYVQIIEQPAQRSHRFRYKREIEGRTAGSIFGSSKTDENIVFPTIQVMNYKGPYVVIVSCVTKDAPYRPHPHNIVGKKDCKKGVCYLTVNNSDMTYSFTSIGIACVKREEIVKSLNVRKSLKLDPFGTGFSHKNIDLSVVRLCFQVFIKGNDGKFSFYLPPIVSDPIYDKKTLPDLTIMKLSHHAAPVSGGTEVIILCGRITKDDVQVWFYELNEDGQSKKWETQAEFQPNDVYKQVAISFRTPIYRDQNVHQPVNVFIEVRQPSDNVCGQPVPFQFIPVQRDPEGLIRIARKRHKFEESDFLEKYFVNLLPIASKMQELQNPIGVPRTVKQSISHKVASEQSMVSVNNEPFSRPSTSHAIGECQNILLPVSPCQSIEPSLLNTASSSNDGDQGALALSFESIPSIVIEQMLQIQSCEMSCDFMEQITNLSGNNLIDNLSDKFESINLNQNLTASLYDSSSNETNALQEIFNSAKAKNN